MGLMKKIFGDYSSRELKSIYPIVDKIESMADKYKAMSDEALRAKTTEFKERLQNGETLDDILPEAFATVREAADRVLGMRPYRVQLVGGIVLHQGRIAEMKTGEGKTLVATLPAYLNALTGRGVHIVTVNDYLAKRDSEWMGKVHRFLGLKVGLIVHGLTTKERQAAYAADITYGTNNTAESTETFIQWYRTALQQIHEAYPYADIIINSIPPVAQRRSYPNITMKTIDAFNKALVEMAKEEGYTFLNSAEVLKDSTGYAKAEYMESSDGIHLSHEGMDVLFDYIRTHAHETEDTRPALENVPTHIATPEEFFVPKATPSPDSSSAQATATPSPSPTATPTATPSPTPTPTPAATATPTPPAQTPAPPTQEPTPAPTPPVQEPTPVPTPPSVPTDSVSSSGSGVVSGG